jgi:hypothetical protein
MIAAFGRLSSEKQQDGLYDHAAPRVAIRQLGDASATAMAAIATVSCPGIPECGTEWPRVGIDARF